MTRHIMRLAFASVAIPMFCIVVAAALAADKKGRTGLDPDGEPQGNLKKGTTECFKVWHNAEGWHVRVVNGKGAKDHRYAGTITVENGVVEQVSSHLAKKNGAEKQWKHSAKKQEISFDFTTDEKEDGINFKASKQATAVRFSLKIDGRDVPEQICIGKHNSNPASSTFELDAHPGDRREVKEAKAASASESKPAKGNKPGSQKK